MTRELESKLNTARLVMDLMAEWIGYIKEIGNECAYSDDILRVADKKLNSIMFKGEET